MPSDSRVNWSAPRHIDDITLHDLDKGCNPSTNHVDSGYRVETLYVTDCVRHWRIPDSDKDFIPSDTGSGVTVKVRPERSWSHISAAGVWGLLPLWVSTWRGLSTPCIPPCSSFFFLINQVSTVWPESEGAVLLYLFTISFSLNCLFLKKNGYNLYKNFCSSTASSGMPDHW